VRAPMGSGTLRGRCDEWSHQRVSPRTSQVAQTPTIYLHFTQATVRTCWGSAVESVASLSARVVSREWALGSERGSRDDNSERASERERERVASGGGWGEGGEECQSETPRGRGYYFPFPFPPPVTHPSTHHSP